MGKRLVLAMNCQCLLGGSDTVHRLRGSLLGTKHLEKLLSAVEASTMIPGLLIM